MKKNQVERKVELKTVEEAWSQLVEELDQLSQSKEESVKELQNRYIEQLQKSHVYLTKRRTLRSQWKSIKILKEKNDRAFLIPLMKNTAL